MAEVATLVVRRVMAPPRNVTVEIGGPQTITLAEAARDVGGHRVLHIGVPGRLSHAVRDGSLLPAAPGAIVATRSWSERPPG